MEIGERKEREIVIVYYNGIQKQVRFTGTFSELAIHYFSDLNIKSIFF